ncbi:MAG: flagellar motor switch protein FliN [Cyanobacteria bacterium P01_H01_bin.74]
MTTENSLTEEQIEQAKQLITESMTAAGGSLGLLLGEEVTLSEPEVNTVENLAALEEPFPGEPKTAVVINHSKGPAGATVYILKNADCRALSAMMMGSTEDDAPEDSLTELEAGATGELFSQIMGAASSAAASLLNTPIEPNSPEVLAYSSETLLTANPDFETGGLSVITYQFTSNGEKPPIEIVETRLTTSLIEQLSLMGGSASEAGAETEEGINLSDIIDVDQLMSEISQPAMSAVGAAGGAASGGGAQGQSVDVDPVMVRPVEFTSFDNKSNILGEPNGNLALVMDVQLSLTVELGKTSLPIKDVLELTRGSVIELQRVAGEPVDLMANGKLIAKGEVVVIEDNFGLRITSIISPEDRLRGL